VHSDPRLVAGEGLRSDVLKCALRPVNDSDYHGRLTNAQIGQLRAIFLLGVCDWNKPGVGQTDRAATWQDFGP
jgi:hypothetical protein